MPYPAYVETRAVTVGGAAVFESSQLIRVKLEVMSTKSLVWNETGYRFERLGYSAISEPGAEATIALPRTDQQGWKDPALNAVIDVSAEGSFTHKYTALVTFLDSDGNAMGIPPVQYAPFPLPDGDGPVDLDLLVPASTVAGDLVAIPDLWTQKVAAAEAAAAAAAAAMVDSDAFVAGLFDDPESATAIKVTGTIAEKLEEDLPTAGAPLFDPLNEARRLFQQRAQFDLEQFAKQATSAWSDGNSWYVQGITKDRTRLIATKTDDTNGLAIGHSDDDGVTWTLDENLPVANAKRIGDLVVLDNGEIVVCALNAASTGPYRSYIYKSSGFATDPATATFSLVFTTPFAQQNTSPTSQYRGFAYDGAARIMGVWYDKKTDNSGGVPNDAGVRARLSTDRGDTWTEVFNLHTFLTALGVNTLASGYHVHSCAYDPIWEAWWISYGDFTGSAGESGVVYSLDNGATWEVAYRGTGAWQSVSIYPMLDYVLLMGDGGASSGVNRIARGAARGEIGALSKGYTPPFMTAIGHKGQDALAPGEWVLLTMTQITGSNRLSRLLATADGERFFELYVDSTYTVSGVSGLRYVVGPTASGKIIGTSVSDGRYVGTASLLTLQAP